MLSVHLTLLVMLAWGFWGDTHAQESKEGLQQQVASPAPQSDFKIGPSGVEGRGVFTARAYAAGEGAGVQFYVPRDRRPASVVYHPPHCNFRKAARARMSDGDLLQCWPRGTNHACRDAPFELCTCPWRGGSLFVATARRAVEVGTEMAFNFLKAAGLVDTHFIRDEDCLQPGDRARAVSCAEDVCGMMTSGLSPTAFGQGGAGAERPGPAAKRRGSHSQHTRGRGRGR